MKTIKKIKLLVLFFIIVLVLSGITAMPLQTELYYLLQTLRNGTRIHNFIQKVYNAVLVVKNNYPFLLYGYDWLAFAHFMFGVLFIGVYRNSVRNKWVVEFGLIACASIIPFALVLGYMRDLPLYWRLIDCSFGVVGGLVLWYVYKQILLLETEKVCVC